MMSTHFTSLSLALLFVSAPAAALDLTGTWVGKLNCSAFDFEQYTYIQRDQILEISQTGNNLSVRFDEGADISTYTGFVVENFNKPNTKGRAAIADCATSPDLTSGFSEIANLKVGINLRTGKGLLSGTSIYTVEFDSDEPETGLEVGQCKWVFKLVSTNDPEVGPGCPG